MSPDVSTPPSQLDLCRFTHSMSSFAICELQYALAGHHFTSLLLHCGAVLPHCPAISGDIGIKIVSRIVLPLQ